jgi:hypothetical protein
MRNDELVENAAREFASAGHGAKGEIVARLAAALGCSTATARERIKAICPMPQRKQRKDAGALTLTEDEANTIAAYIRSTVRETGTGRIDLSEAVEILRANGEIVAGRVDEDTGEFFPLSESQIRTSLRRYGVNTTQLEPDTPAVRLSSPHPNYCWQIDASVSRQYYLGASGTVVMDKEEFYRGKPDNFARVNEQRLWRYLITDHASGCFDVLYVQGSESSANVALALIHGMSKGMGCMYGRPLILVCDPGSGNRAAAVFNLCRALGIRVIVNRRGNSRAKGQVEKGHHQIETSLEAALKGLPPVCSVEEMNVLCEAWARRFCATRVHTRTGLTRRDGWGRITPDQLVLVPPPEQLQSLANSHPKTCTVRDYMIRFQGKVYDLRHYPGGINNGSRVEVVRNALDQACVRVIMREGNTEQYLIAPEIPKDEWGFVTTAARIGERHVSVPDSPAQTKAKQLDRIINDAKTDAEVEEKRKAKAVPFGGRIDPRKLWQQENDVIPPMIPRAGKPSDVVIPNVVKPADLPAIPPRPLAPAAELPLFTGFELVKLLKIRVEERGQVWNPDWWGVVAQRWPNGLTEEQLDAAAGSLLTPNLRAIAGGAA